MRKFLVIMSILFVPSAVLAGACGDALEESTGIKELLDFIPIYSAAFEAVVAAPTDKAVLRRFAQVFDTGLQGKPFYWLPIPTVPIADEEYLDFLARILTIYPDFPETTFELKHGDSSNHLLKQQEEIARIIISANSDYGLHIIMRALDSNNLWISVPVANSLGYISQPAHLVEALKEAAGHPHEWVRFGAAMSIGYSSIKTAEIEAIRCRLEKDPHSGVAAKAVYAKAGATR
jgi:hypothetical protein